MEMDGSSRQYCLSVHFGVWNDGQVGRTASISLPFLGADADCSSSSCSTCRPKTSFKIGWLLLLMLLLLFGSDQASWRTLLTIWYTVWLLLLLLLLVLLLFWLLLRHGPEETGTQRDALRCSGYISAEISNPIPHVTNTHVCPCNQCCCSYNTAHPSVCNATPPPPLEISPPMS